MNINSEIESQLNALEYGADKNQQQIGKREVKEKNKEDAIYFNFSYSALKLLGKNLYNNPWTAISELVANGLDAKAKKIYVFIDMVDKQNSTIEIIDNGMGMSYSELAEKYVWIGRNKREDDIFTSNDKKYLMGRKGIGKLAALYLTNQYYLLSKKAGEDKVSRWSLNMLKYKDSDFPRLDKIDSEIYLNTDEFWSKFTHGTAIKLSNVNLYGIGEKTIEGMKRTLADFYLLDEVDSKIFFSVKERNSQPILFEELNKTSGFKNLYAVFDNSISDIRYNLRDTISFKSKVVEIANKDRSTIILDKSKFKYAGRKAFKGGNGKPIEKDYELSGWIGIHSTIEMNESKDPLFIRNKAYSSTRLRLYVRRKLADSNLLDILGFTHGMANYIEGDISFDILDDDELQDISTSNRQGFLDDERISLLKRLVKPIVNSLISERVRIAKQISKEEDIYFEKEKQELEKKAKLEEEKKEQEKNRRMFLENENLKLKEDSDRIKEEKQEMKKKLFLLENNFRSEGEAYKLGMHLTVNFAKRIRGSVIKMKERIQGLNYGIEELMAIDLNAEKIERMPYYVEKTTFSLNSEKVKLNLVDYIYDYLVAEKSSGLTYEFDLFKRNNILKFDFAELILFLENLISNSRKNGATSLLVKSYISDKFTIDFIDNGKGLDPNFKNNPDKIFELAITSTRGFGIGAYHMKNIINKMNGEISALDREDGSGLIIRIRF